MSSEVDQFIGGIFSWFTGVVEDVDDPLQMGRARVRCIGYHTSDRALIKTSDLPWASVMTPIHSASMSGIGMSATGILPGSWVIGFFRDGPSAQDPIILGTIPSTTSKVDSKKGFSDPSGTYPIKSQLGKPDTPIEARKEYNKSEAYLNRKNYLEEAITAGSEPAMTNAAMKPLKYEWFNWNIDDVVQPKYPKNQVFHSESGHVYEVDDTPGYERTLDFHKSGTYVEIDKDGNKTTTVVGDNQTVVVKNDSVHIKGHVMLTVDGNLRQYVGGDYILEVGGNKSELIHGNSLKLVDNTDAVEAKKQVETYQTKIAGHPTELKANGLLADGDKYGLVPSITSSGANFNYAEINLNGNVYCKNGATGSFSVGGGLTVTITKGIITNIG